MPLSPATRKALKARAHTLNPVVIIGDAGLTPSVLKEIDRSLSSHELIKVRVANDDREERITWFDQICAELKAEAVQHIGKLLVLFRVRPPEPPKAVVRTPVTRSSRSAYSSARPGAQGMTLAQRRLLAGRSASAPRVNPLSGRPVKSKAFGRNAPAPAAPSRPNRTERIRSSGQRSTKKPFQGN